MSIDFQIVNKSEVRKQTAKDVKKFLQTGGVVQVIPARKARSGARTWAKR